MKPAQSTQPDRQHCVFLIDLIRQICALLQTTQERDYVACEVARGKRKQKRVWRGLAEGFTGGYPTACLIVSCSFIVCTSVARVVSALVGVCGVSRSGHVHENGCFSDI